MTTASDEIWASAQKPSPADGVRLRDTYWGFALAETSDRANLVESILKLTALCLFPCVGVLIAFSGIAGVPFGLTGSLGILVAFLLVGAALFLHASRGLRRALQVDTSHAVFRLGTENTKGKFWESRNYRFRDVESVFLIRENAGARTANLNFRLKGSSQPVFILSGPERMLVPVLERITESVQRRKGPRKARTKTTGRFVHVKFS